MSNDFDFNSIGKRLPYTTPDNYLDDIETQVLATIQADPTPANQQQQRHRHLYLWGSGLIAASVALLLVFKVIPYYQQKASFDAVEQAFANLSDTDQDYLIEVYQDDLFIND